MGIVIDLIVVVFVLLCVFYGYKKGLVKVGIKMLSFLIAIIITFILYRPISMMVINYTNIDESIQNMVVEKIGAKDEASEEKIEQNIIENTKSNIVTEIAKPLSYNIIYAVVMIILFIISKIIVFFISSLTDVLTNLPIIKQFNEAGGILYGVIISFSIIYLILLILSFIISYNTNNQIYKLINETYITKLMYEYNIFNIFFM